jgi:hypothetical protein
MWYIIRSLATACLLLQTGTTEDDPIEGWKPITHLDLQLPNVLLDVSQPPLEEKFPTGLSAGVENSGQDATTPEADGVDQYPVVTISPTSVYPFTVPKVAVVRSQTIQRTILRPPLIPGILL